MTSSPALDHDPDCLICQFVATAQPATAIYEDDLWFAGVLENLEVPGWVVLGLKCHAFDAMGMTDEEAASFGPLVKKLSIAIQEALGSERVYLLGYGENAQHWHVLLSSRGSEIPVEHRHFQFWGNREKYVNPPAAEAAAAKIREALQKTNTPTAEEVA